MELAQRRNWEVSEKENRFLTKVWKSEWWAVVFAKASGQDARAAAGLAPADSEDLRAAWQAAGEGVLKGEKERRSFDSIREQFLLLVTCRDERHQVELLQRFQGEGLQVKALLS